MANRQTELLREAAKAFEDCHDPFATDHLVKHNVTSDECGDLSGVISTIIFGYLASPTDDKNALVLRGALSAAGMPTEVVEEAVASLKLHAATKRP